MRTVKDNSFDPREFDMGHTYYWRVDEVSGDDPKVVRKGRVWSFTVFDSKAKDP